MKCLRATLTEIVSSVSTLDTSQINHEGLAELMELLSPSHAIDKILYHVRKKGAGKFSIIHVDVISDVILPKGPLHVMSDTTMLAMVSQKRLFYDRL